ncbi:hypothetical protein ZIOFF_042815 [Zingiber officinale]|uniref:Retrovirus-related Pol polyprotein from transposon TNT 1-94 n=1 Tax=Zingiber officinale TaxID=94328 RepID=A0A8J5KTN6_ZINOF|nr:hypothetical protein ZIOFF_042815 [Zingiber officinale]
MASENNFVQPAIPRFDGHYDHWSMLMENFLRSKEYWQVVESGVAEPAVGEMLSSAQKSEFQMENCNSVNTPAEVGLKLVRNPEGRKVDSTLYKQIIGNLMYLTATRPDIMHAALFLFVEIYSQELSVSFPLNLLTDPDEPDSCDDASSRDDRVLGSGILSDMPIDREERHLQLRSGSAGAADDGETVVVFQNGDGEKYGVGFHGVHGGEGRPRGGFGVSGSAASVGRQDGVACSGGGAVGQEMPELEWGRQTDDDGGSNRAHRVEAAGDAERGVAGPAN